MYRLLRVELKKIFYHKSIYIVWILMLMFCLLNNILYKTDYDEDGNYKYIEHEDLVEEEKRLKDELSKYNKDNVTENTMYITIKIKLDLVKIKQTFSNNSWQYKKINSYLYDILYKINYYNYIEIEHEELLKLQEQYDTILSKLNDDDYQYFLNKEIKELKDIEFELNNLYLKEENEKNKQQILNNIEENKFKLKILNYRLIYDIKEDNSYLNRALESYQENYKTINYYKKLDNKITYQEKTTYQEAFYDFKISEYIIANKQNINKENNLNYQLRTIVDDYEFFIVVLIFIICATTICDEFKDGTIKLLLIKPYSRGKILLSKFLASIIVICITILLLIGLQFVIGGIIFGVDSLKLPIVVYDFNKSSIVEYSIFEYMLLRIIIKIPLLLILIIIVFFISVLYTNMMLSITMPLMLYMFSPTLIFLTKKYKLEFMKYLVNINWNLEEYLFGFDPKIQFLSIKFSIIILLLYFVLLSLATYFIFKKKNIKNI